MIYVLVLCYGDICLDFPIHTLLYVWFPLMYRQAKDSIFSLFRVDFGVFWVVWTVDLLVFVFSNSRIRTLLAYCVLLRITYILVGLVGLKFWLGVFFVVSFR